MVDDSADRPLGDWVYGDLNTYPNGDAYITEKSDGVELSYPVEAESVGQFTGLFDCNGIEIYEGDLIAFERKDGTFGEPFEITFEGGVFCMGKKPIPSQGLIDYTMLTVIGNSYLINKRTKDYEIQN